ncbi:DUF1552 domain-containing protein [Planctomycetes bacterium K23_9]|uniref:DUF1552 domain-containing protein n=1 Tax=Stieleria marina TaxID=1930275 RepID=A0A517NXD8_9BACT|nr:hypothetical protein K239x_37680 [Planctomycetes bacterium K23_9]
MIQRRTVLRGLGLSVALPLLERDAIAATVTAPMRMVCVANPLGFIPDVFFPKQAGSDYQTTPLLEPLPRDKFTVFSNLDHGVSGGHSGVHAFLSGIRDNEASQFAAKNITVDQRAAEQVGSTTRFPSIVASVGEGSGTLAPQNSWTRNGVNIPPISDQRDLFRALFVDRDHSAKSQQRESLRRNKSILDSVRQQARILAKELGARDRAKLDEYFTSVREVEKRLQMAEAWVDKPKPTVDLKTPSGKETFTQKLPLFYDLITLALQTDSTRVATLSIPGTLPVGDLGLSGGYHSFSHHGKDPELRRGLMAIETMQIANLARFIRRLDAIEQPDGRTLLDCTMVLSGSGMGNGSSHSNRDLPIVLAGGGFKHGHHLIMPKKSHLRVPLSNLFTTMLQRFGVETDRFNKSTGTLSRLELA